MRVRERLTLGTQFVLTAINPTKSGYAHFSFATNKFFSRFRFDGASLGRSSFFCTLYARVSAALERTSIMRSGRLKSSLNRCSSPFLEIGEAVEGTSPVRSVLRRLIGVILQLMMGSMLRVGSS